MPVAGKRFQRRYKESAIFSPITGYFSLFSQTGLESAENHVLDGTDPRLATTDLVNRIIGKRVGGGTVETTIDPKAQRAAYAALKGSGARRAAAVAMDARTGAILVMASTPSYDANDVAVPDAKKAQAAFTRLNAQPLKPLLNKAANEVFPPGSTFKTVVVAAALAAGSSGDEQVRAGRSYRPAGAGQAINNDVGDIGGQCDLPAIPLIDSYAQSCNTTFAFMGAEKPGNTAVAEQAARFGFYHGIGAGKGLSGAASSFPKTDQPSLSALGSIGQGSTVATPLQMALVASAAINDGKVMRPYLVGKVRGPDGAVVDETSASRLSQALTSGQAAELRAMMRAVITKGTGKRLQGGPIMRRQDRHRRHREHGYNDRWFIGFGPKTDPRYAVAVMTEADGYGIESGPIAADIIGRLGG